MKNSKLLRVTAVIQAVVLLLSVFSLCVFADTTKNISLASSTDWVAPGSEVIIYVKSNESFSAFGFDTEIGIDTESFTVTKVTVAQTGKSGVLSNSSDGKLKINWLAESGNETWNSGALFQIHLNAKTGTLGEKAFTVNKFKAYDSDLKNINFNLSQAIKVNIGVKESDKSDSVIYAEEKIAEIGTVEATDECLRKITEAQLAYNGCTAAEKLQVSNADVLTEAINKYNKLKAEQNEKDNKDELDAEIAEFRKTYKDLLDLTEKTVKGDHFVRLSEAVVVYGQKTLYVRNQLKTEYEHLLALKNIAQQMVSSPEEVDSFRDTFGSLLSLTPEGISYSDVEAFEGIKENIEAALATYEYLNDISKSKLKKEYKLLIKLRERCVEIEKENSPEPDWVIEQYNAFREKYLTLLLKTEGEVTEKDSALIQQALGELKNLKPAVSGKLINEYEHLMNLLNALNTSEYEGVGTVTTVEVPVETVVEVPVETVVQVPVTTTEEAQAKGGLISVFAHSSEGFGILVFAMMFTAFVLFAAPAIAHFIVKAKEQREEGLL